MTYRFGGNGTRLPQGGHHEYQSHAPERQSGASSEIHVAGGRPVMWVVPRQTNVNALARRSQLNPYEAHSSSAATTQDRSERISIIRAALSGAISSIVTTIPIAGVVGLVFRFPVPFYGYMSGPSALVMGMFAAVFYGLAFGGWVVVGSCGAVVSIPPFLLLDAKKAKIAARWLSVAVALAGCLIMATLDWFIGPF